MNKAMTNNRWFTVVNTNILKDSKYEVLMHNVLSIKNRFKIDVSKGQTPINAAEKALSKICNRKNPQIKYFKYRLEVCPKSYDELKHVNPLSNWKIT